MSTTPTPADPPVARNGYGTTAMVLGIVAVVAVFTGWLIPLAIATGILATVFGVLGRRRAARGEAADGSQALTGLILGPIAVTLAVLAIVAALAFGAFEGGGRLGGPFNRFDDHRWEDRGSWFDDAPRDTGLSTNT